MSLTHLDLQWFCSAMCTDISGLVLGPRQRELFQALNALINNPADADREALWEKYYHCRRNVRNKRFQSHVTHAAYLLLSIFNRMENQRYNGKALKSAFETFERFATKRNRPELVGPYLDFLTDHGLTLQTLDRTARHAFNCPTWKEIIPTLIPTEGTLDLKTFREPRINPEPSLLADIYLRFRNAMDFDRADATCLAFATLKVCLNRRHDSPQLANFTASKDDALNVKRCRSRFTYGGWHFDFELESLQFGELSSSKNQIAVHIKGDVEFSEHGPTGAGRAHFDWKIDLDYHPDRLEERFPGFTAITRL